MKRLSSKSRVLIILLVIGLTGAAAWIVQAQDGNTPNPESVTIAGTVQSVLGCDGDWMPECEATFLTYDAGQDAWSATFDLPAGNYEYKAALNGGWDENYGLEAAPGGANIPLALAEDTSVTFFYDHKTHWITDNVNSVIATLPGTHQSELGCLADASDGDWEPGCLRTWLQDPDGDGLYTYTTVLIPAGDYEGKVAINRGWSENYGVDGASNGGNIPYTIPADGHEVVFTYDAVSHVLTIDISAEPVVSAEEIEALKAALAATVPPPGDLTKAKAYWVTRDTIAWDIDEDVALFKLYYALDGGLTIEDGQLVGGEKLSLKINRDGLSADILAKFPHLAGYKAFTIKEADLALVPDILRGQYAISVAGSGSVLLDATSLQIAGVLDDLYTYDGSLGVTYDGGVPTLRVWAPTAQSVKLHLFDDSDPATTSTVQDMTYDTATGVWSVTGQADWTYKFYLYEVQVFVRSTGQIETNLVTDPYSFSLSTNSQRSQIVDLFNDPALMPEGWSAMVKPALNAPEDIALYELHIRDFSAKDESVPADYRGTFMAFTVPESSGMQHLTALADAGLTHIHLLPVFDIATINEDAAARTEPDAAALAALPPDSEEQQAAVTAVKDVDAYNWGYDPFHYTVPEGSYATDPNGIERIIEFRQMVMGLNGAKLRVVMDVVYNHTNASGQNPNSVLDKIVPGYYHRLNERGEVTTSTCCQNTATEHNMMRKLMVDSVVTWATAYKVDGFRFDLMGHHMVGDMAAVHAALAALTLANDGVDGASLYVYGEGWNFGEVQDNARGLNATQINLGGLGIGTFNDRIRDAAKGVTPFSAKQEQGFINGLYTDPNAYVSASRTPEDQLTDLLLKMDQIRVGLAGNLRDFTFEGREGTVVTGAEVPYGGSPAGPTGYTLDPQEQIAYVSAHDNETLFDVIQYSAPASATLADRVRMQNLGLSLVTLSQGVPFYDAGSDMLRSKSGDTDSYNSGDWFNALDWTYATTNWGVGLPPADKNAGNWEILKPLLADPNLKPGQEQILAVVNHMREMLRIRKSSPLFRLPTAEDIQARLTFQNTGPDQVPGVIVMTLSDQGDLADLDPTYALIVVVFNATPGEIAYPVEALVGLDMQLHPVQAESADAVVRGAAFDAATGTLTVPGRTTAVFVLPQ